MEQQNQQPTHDQTKNKPLIKTNWKLFGVVTIVAIILAVGGILLLKTMELAPYPTPPAQQTLPPAPSLQAIDNQQSTIDTSGWQTYRNDEFGFEVKYPADWKILSDVWRIVEFGQEEVHAPDPEFGRSTYVPVTTKGVRVWVHPSIESLSNDSGRYFANRLWIDPSIDLSNSSRELSLEEWIAYAYGNLKNVEGGKVEKIVFGKQNYEGWQIEKPRKFILPEVYLEDKDGKIFEFLLMDSTIPKDYSYQEYREVFYQILSTFQAFEKDTRIQDCAGISNVEKRIGCWIEESSVQGCGSVPYSSTCYYRIGTLKNDMEVCERAGASGGYLCKISVAEATAKYNEAQVKAIIAERANAVVRALKGKDMEAIATFVHPQKPLYFWSINAGFELSKEKIPSFFTDQTEHTGAYDGSGRPFTFTQAEYYEDYIYDRDYLNAPQVSYDLRYMSSATTGGGQFDRYHAENPISVTYAFPQSSDDAAFDWRNLRLWFTEEDGVWYLREIMQNQWAI